MKKEPLKQDKKNVAPAEAIPVRSSNINKYAALYIGLIVLIAAVNFLFQHNQGGLLIERSWGMNNFSYFPVWMQFLVFALLICVGIPSLNNKVMVWLEKLSRSIDSEALKKSIKMLSFASLSLILTLLLYVFKIKYDFLGDRDIRVGEAIKGIYVHDEYLTMYLLHHLNSLMGNILNLSPHQTFVFHSIAGGFFYFFIGLLIADLLFDKTEHKIIFFLLCVSISTVMVFSGYVEIYAFPVVSVSLYIYSCLLFLKKKAHIILPFLFLVFAIALHLEQVSLIPSFVFLTISRYKVSAKINLPILLGLALISVPVIYVVYPILHMDPSTVVQLKTNPSFPGEYTLLSFTHFWEFFNSQFLSSGMLIFLFPIILFVSYRKKILLDECSKFLLITVLFSFVIVFTANTMMGSADWDICSFPAISLSIFVSYTLLKLFNKMYTPKKISYVLLTAIAFNTLNCWAWIGINSGDKSVKKIHDMLVNDPGYFYNVYVPPEMHLTAAYYGNHLIKEGDETVIAGYQKYGSLNSRAAYNYVVLQLTQKDTTGAIRTLKKMIEDFPLAEHAIEELSILYDKKQLGKEEFELGQMVENMYSQEPEKIITALSTRYLKTCFSYQFRYSSLQNDTANVEKARQLIKSLAQYPAQ